MRAIVAFLSGVLFAAGLTVSAMTHPTKVIDFLDFAGAWDPSLMLVMGGGVVVNAVFFAIAKSRGKPLLASSFSLPAKTAVDARLVAGAAIFGLGWGLGGFCPGPALVSVVGGATPVIAFVVTMLATMAAFDAIEARARKAASSPAPVSAAVDPEV